MTEQALDQENPDLCAGEPVDDPLGTDPETFGTDDPYADEEDEDR